MLEGFWWLVLGIPILILTGISILFYIIIILVPYFILLLIVKWKPISNLLEGFTELDKDDTQYYLLWFSIPFDIYFAYYLYDRYEFKWTSLSDLIFDLFDFIF